MASKNLGAVIQRAISDGAFRRQLQSDPAAALRGFNLSPDEVAAIRSGDSSKLMSLGVDQRMSKAFTVGGGFLGASRSTTSDLGGGAGASTIATDATAGTREGIVDPAAAGTRAINDAAPVDLTNSIIGGVSGTRAIHDSAPADLRSAADIGDVSATRAVNDVAPFGSTGTSAVEDANSTEFAATQHAGDPLGVRPVDDVAPFGTTGTSAVEDASAPESVASHMADTADATAIRPINDIAPFEGNVDGAAAGSDAMLGDARLDPGINGMDGSHADAASSGGGNTGL